MPVKRTPTEAVAVTVAAMKKTSRILLPIGIAVLVTGTGLLVFFSLATTLS